MSTWLRDEAAPDAFAGVKYVVFGCGNSDWTATYQSVPRYIDERIAALGGERIAARGEGNAQRGSRRAVRSLVRRPSPRRRAGVFAASRA